MQSNMYNLQIEFKSISLKLKGLQKLLKTLLRELSELGLLYISFKIAIKYIRSQSTP